MSDNTEPRQFTGHPSQHGWLPHKPETWTHRYAKLRRALRLQHYEGYWKDGKPVMRTVDRYAGDAVKIVMVSRFGDVGVTENLDADTGYGARVYLNDLCDFTPNP